MKYLDEYREEQLLNDPEILDKHVRAIARPNAPEGVGCCEAPRGTLIHHYKIDEQGLMRWANLIIATGHNSMAMNRSILQVAKHFVRGERMTPGMLNRVEAVIRLRSLPELHHPCVGRDAPGRATAQSVRRGCARSSPALLKPQEVHHGTRS